MSISSLLVVSILLHLYIGTRIIPSLSGAVIATLFTLLLLVSATLVPAGLLARRLARPPRADTLAWIGLPFLGLFSSLFVLTLLRDGLMLTLWLIDLLLPGHFSLPEAGRTTAAAVPALGLVVTLLGFANARRRARVVTVPIPVDHLPAALHGFTIVQISDIHVGPTIRERYVESIVEAVNHLKPDLVAITGDLVDGGVPELGAQVAPLRRLKSRHGSFFVTGNHEYYSGVDPWLAELPRLGIRILHNEHVVIEHAGARLLLAGVPDYNAGHFDDAHRSDPAAALAGAPSDAAVRVLLAHQPRSAWAAAKAGYDLQLSGHTHGGQFLPWNFFVQFQQPFTAGLHQVGRLRVYVSRGTGYWGPPKRFGAPSEITRVRLVTAELGAQNIDRETPG
jgi:predicted MPP superfamily phosphohydrolase